MNDLYLLIDGEQKGPYSPQQVRSMYNNGFINSRTHLWHDGQQEWLPLDSFFNQPESPHIESKPDLPYDNIHVPETRNENVQIKTETSGLAICSLVFSLLGLFPVGIIMGHCANRYIKEDAALTGRGLATAGLILGYVEMTFCALAFLSFIGVVSLGAPSHPSKEQMAKLEATIDELNKPDVKRDDSPTNNLALDASDGFLSVPWSATLQDAKRNLAAKGYVLNEERDEELIHAHGLVYSGGTFANLKVKKLTLYFDDATGAFTQAEILFMTADDSTGLSAVDERSVETALMKLGARTLTDQELARDKATFAKSGLDADTIDSVIASCPMFILPNGTCVELDPSLLEFHSHPPPY